jgi:transposase
MLGIDVSKAELVCTLIDPQTHRRLWRRTFPNTHLGREQLLAQTPPDTAWVMEPTGRYSLAAAKQATAAGQPVLLAPSKKAHAYLNSLSDRAKTDNVDSEGLALFGATRPQTKQLAPYPIRAEAVEKLHQLLTARKGLSRALASLGQQAKELPYAKAALDQAIRDLLAQQKELDRQIRELTSEAGDFPETRRLLAVPGVGPVTAATVAARLKGRTFAKEDNFVSYIGLAVDVDRSGTRRGKEVLTKHGDAELRRLFYLAAQANLRVRSSPFRDHYERERAKGRHKTEALCIVARKIAQVCWSMVQHGTQYDPDRVYRQANAPKPEPQETP